MAKNPIVRFEMENGGVFEAELYPEIAPNTVMRLNAVPGAAVWRSQDTNQGHQILKRITWFAIKIYHTFVLCASPDCTFCEKFLCFFLENKKIVRKMLIHILWRLHPENTCDEIALGKQLTVVPGNDFHGVHQHAVDDAGY